MNINMNNLLLRTSTSRACSSRTGCSFSRSSDLKKTSSLFNRGYKRFFSSEDSAPPAKRSSNKKLEAAFAKTASLIPRYVQKHCPQVEPKWKKPAEKFFETFPKLAVAMPKYQAFLSKTEMSDLKQLHVFMNDKASIELIEYYLACGLILRRADVEAVETDSDKLLQLAREIAEKDVEPFFDEARALALDYVEDQHRKLEDMTVWLEFSDELFWHHSFKEFAGPKYEEYCDTFADEDFADGSGTEQGKMIGEYASALKSKDKVGIDQALLAFFNENQQRKELSQEIYTQWLDVAGHTVRGKVRNVLINFNLLLGYDKAWEGKDLVQEPKRNLQNVKEADLSKK